MTLEEMRERRHSLEIMIADMITNFAEETGLEVTNLELFPVQAIQERKPSKYVVMIVVQL